ncbi:MAG: uncharacterized protein JWN88_1227 [Frankiales bacterium]|jgi:hypothetical protein|nr:uncharacterized protein [Frankiales bacterium]
MRHPTEGVLRRLLDEPAGVADADRAHVVDCSDCLAVLAAARDDAHLVGAALGSEGSADVDLTAAWARHEALAAGGSARSTSARAPRLAAPGPSRPGRKSAAGPGRHSGPRPSRLRAGLRRPAVAALAVAVVLTGASTAAANDWLQVFRTERVAPLSIATGDLFALPDLSAYGDLAVTSEPDVHEVPDAAAAAAETGLDVPAVSELPGGVTADPVYQVGGKVSATFTFSAEKAARAAAGAGEPLPPVPPGLSGSSVRLDAGPGVAQVWASSAGAPALVVGRAVAPTAFSSGVPFEVVRDYLLSLPGFPDQVADQLRSFAADGSTLPLPVPADQLVTTTTQVDGNVATLLRTRDRTLAAVVWVDEGVLTVVAGALDSDEVVAVARGLR